MTLLVFLPTATPAGVVATNLIRLRLAGSLGSATATRVPVRTRAGDRAAQSSIRTIVFGLAAGPGNIIDVGAQIARRFALRRGLLHFDGDVAAQKLEQVIDNMMLDVCLQAIEHTKRLVFEFDERIALRDRAEVDAVAYDIYGVDMIHPQAVDHLQCVRAFEVADGRDTQAGILLNQFIKLIAAFFVMVRDKLGQFVEQVIFAYRVNIFGQHFVGYLYPDFQGIEDMLQLLFLVDDVARDIRIDDAPHLGADHAKNALVQISAFKHGAAVGVDHFALFGDHVVIFDDIFTGIEVVAFNARLRLFNE